ncbi:MAG TPA: hypothetical protein VHD90_07805 [Phototrophicaceae bacterium]|nr:hypothetical protein [Phototrophicaceae bacterium]
MKLLAALLIVVATQVSGVVQSGATEILFPQAIRIMVNLTVAPQDVAAASLTIMPPDEQPITVSVDPKSSIVTYSGASVTLGYVWKIPVDHPPPLFSTVNYQWSVRTTDGAVSTYNGGSVVFADPRVDWMRYPYPQAHLDLTVPASFSPFIDALRQTHALIAQNTGFAADEKLLVSPVDPGCTPSPDDPGKAIVTGKFGLVVTCDPGIEQAVMSGYHVLVLPPEADPQDFLTSMWTQQAYTQWWDQKGVPVWFIDGLGQFYNPERKDGLLLPVQQAARSGSLYNLDQMSKNISPASALWRAQSYGMVLYIVHQIGVQGLFNLARVPVADFDMAYQQAMHVPTSALIPAWQQWIFTASAQGDYGITPYQPPTSTPTITPTFTNTATLTPTTTLTPTMTPLPSSTPPGVRTYTPPPTVTPSSTATQSPPSVTPRLPGSLPTPTPEPTALQQAVAQPGFQAGAITLLGLLLVLLIFLYVRLGNRR